MQLLWRGLVIVVFKTQSIMIGRLSAVIFAGIIIYCAKDATATTGVSSPAAAVTPLSVEPMWDKSDRFDIEEDCGIQELNASRNGSFLVQGSKYRTCIVQVNASSNYRILIEASTGNLSTDQEGLLYVERQERQELLLHCESRHIVFSVRNETCRSAFYHHDHESIRFRLQGAFKVTIRVIFTEFKPTTCADGYIDDGVIDGDRNDPSVNVSETPYCTRLVESNALITCDPLVDETNATCTIQFPLHCSNSTLSNGYVVSSCLRENDNDLVENQTIAMMYPIEMYRLEIQDNAITTIRPGAFSVGLSYHDLYLNRNRLVALTDARIFHGLRRLRELELSFNRLRTLSDGVFTELTHLEVLDLHENQLTAVTEALFIGIDNLREFSVDSNQVESLNDGDFRNLKKLYWLYLSYNNLTTLPVNLFRNLTSLHVLKLTGNCLTTLPVGPFRGLFNLEELFLDGNQLMSLNSTTFLDLICLRRLDLNYNNLIKLETGLFLGLGKLQVLLLCANKLVSLDGQVFEDLGSLQDLKLNANILTTLPYGVFKGLGKLQALLLYSNDLVRLDGQVFEDLGSLQELQLNYNNLTTLPVNLFRNLTSLDVLKLNHNRLTILPVGPFRGLFNLEELFLDWNQLISLNSTTFVDLICLRRLDLNFNNLIELEMGLFLGLGNLSELRLHGNKIVSLDGQVFEDLVSLQELDLRWNYLTKLPYGVFKGLVELKRLSLSFNPIVSLNDNNTETADEVFQDLVLLTKLSLCWNRLNMLTEDLFSYLINLEELDLSVNRLTSLPNGVFNGLVELKWLSINHNKLVSLNDNNTETADEVFQDLVLLTKLSLYMNKLNMLTEGLFQYLVNLEELYLAFNRLTSLPNGVFKGLVELKWLTLHNNSLFSLNDNNTETAGEIFKDLINLEKIDLWHNSLTALPNEVFNGLTNLQDLGIGGNELTNLTKDVFEDLISLKDLKLTANRLALLPNGIFRNLMNLEELYLDENQLVILSDGIFQALSKLTHILLYGNELVILPETIFKHLFNLRYLYMYMNQVETLNGNTFKGLVYMQILALAYNKLKYLHPLIFNETVSLTKIYVNNNMLTNFPYVNHLKKLIWLDLRYNTLTRITSGVFSTLSIDFEMIVSQHEICECYVPDGVICDVTQVRSPYLTCDRLLSSKALLMVTWVIGLNALGGNIFVIIWRTKKTQKNFVQNTLLSNLAISDSLMGMYMIIITAADVYFGEYFPMQSNTWRTGITCRIAGAFSISSSEASVLFVTIISIDRCINIKNPYSNYKMGKTSTILSIALVWMFSLIVGIVPSILAGNNFRFYDNSHVCIGLPLSLNTHYRTDTSNKTVDNYTGVYRLIYVSVSYAVGYEYGNYFSIAIFLGLNLICFLVILGSYIEILRSITKISAEAGRSRTMKDQMKTTTTVMVIVATDFVCWFPIILMGILVQTQAITLPPSVYAWVVTFVLPINSAVNPYLYTVADIISNYKSG